MVTFLLYFLLPLLAVLTAISIAMIISTVVAKGQDGQPLRLKTLGTRPNMPSDNPFVSGNPVPPEQLIGRYRELRRIARSIVTGQSTLITGSPHCGKTSVLHYIRVAPEETERANALYGDEAEKLIFSYLDAGICGPQFDQAKFWENVLEQPIQEHLLAQETEYTPLSQAYHSCQEKNFEAHELQKLGIDTQNLVHQHSVSNSIMELERYGFLKKDKKVKGGWRISPSVFLSFVPNMAEKLSRDKNVDLLRLQGNQLPPQQKILQWVHQGMKWLIVPIILIGAIIGGGLLSGENVGNMCQYLPWLCEFITGLWEKITALFG
jgi:hypothetical protein